MDTMDAYELMKMSIDKNIEELSELCVDNGVDNAYDLMDLINRYMEILNVAKSNGGRVSLEVE